MSKVIDTYQQLYPDESGGQIILTAVLTQDFRGQQAVYVGKGSKDFVKKHGQKQTYDRARYFYPGLKKEDYRR
jgi:hypothetical protein